MGRNFDVTSSYSAAASPETAGLPSAEIEPALIPPPAFTTIAAGWRRVLPYVSIARPDHWFKNVFMLLGAMLAGFYHPEALSLVLIPKLIAALGITCLLASSNYV